MLVNNPNNPNPEKEFDRLLTAQEVADLLNVPKSYIYWLTHRKKIPCIKIHGLLRFKKAVVDQWIKAMERRVE